LIRRNWLACLGLATLYALLSFAAFLFKEIPLSFQANLGERYEAMSDAEVLSFFRWYTLGWAVGLLPLFLALRLVAARLYAVAVVKGVRTGRIHGDQLSRFEQHTLDRLDLLTVEPLPRRHLILRAAGRLTSLALRAGATVAMLLIWFSLIAQMYTGAFLNYQLAHEWINQPMIQLPYFNYIPASLVRSAGG